MADIKEKRVISFARERLDDEIRQNKLGADNNHYINYWRAYLDGAIAQMKEVERNNNG